MAPQAPDVPVSLSFRVVGREVRNSSGRRKLSSHVATIPMIPWVMLLSVAVSFSATGKLLTAQSAGSAVSIRPDTLDPMARAMNAEEKNDPRTAATAYREVLRGALNSVAGGGDRVALSLLGLERVWFELGIRDSILPVVEHVLVLRPADPVARSIQLRTLVSINRNEDARQAFLAWRRSSGTDGAPFREYARLLLAAGRAQAADSVLTEAGRVLGAGGMLSGEVAQLHVALGRWNSAAVAFREALVDQPYLETAGLFALGRAPIEARDSIRTILEAAPIDLAPRRLLSLLELSWGEPRRAWRALSSVKADDSTAAAWRSFGERAEMAAGWPVARDAWEAVFERRGDLESQSRAAQAALNANDPAGALEIVRRVARGAAAGTTAERARVLVPIEISALGELGRAAEAQQRLDAASKNLDDASRAAMARPLVAAWLRAGDMERAREAVRGSDLIDDDETAGWLALYEGDLATARKRLVRAETKRSELVDALGLLARVRLDNSPALGLAFLTLARRDSVGAVNQFVALADSGTGGTAAPAVLALAARILFETTRESATPHSPLPSFSALELWNRIIIGYPRSPEAPEALLASARAVRDAGNQGDAIVRLEKLLVEYPDSALLPQARRDLEQIRGRIPPLNAAHYTFNY